MTLKLYNTLTQRLEALKLQTGAALGMYACGPTVYDFAHIGNFRTFIFQDLLRRYLVSTGYRLTHVMNITDVDDRIIVNSRAAGVSLKDYTIRYAEAFFEDMGKLRVQRPEIIPWATQHIDEIVELILKLRENGYTYERDGSTYYRIIRFPDYGKLSHLDPATIQTEGQIDADAVSYTHLTLPTTPYV